jgi:transposase
VHTISNEINGGRRRRREHSAEFKAQVVAACSVAGVSNAAVAMAHGLNPNLARRWVREAERRAGGMPVMAAPRAAPKSFVPVQIQTPAQLPAPTGATAATAPTDIRVEVRRGPNAISVSWPCSAAAECAAWLTGLLR